MRSVSALAVALAAAIPASAAPPDDWPTLHGDLTRSGFYPVFPARPLKLLWRRELADEMTGARAQVIVAAGKACLGTYAGKLYAWDAATGEQRWVVRTGGAILHSPAFADGNFYAGSMDRRVYAVSADDGRVRWTYEADAGVCVSPAVSGGLVFFGDRAGTFHAVRTADGTRAWTFAAGGPVLTTASVAEDGRSVVFASEDMHACCVEAATGRLIWKSRKMAGVSVRDHFPVLVGGLALITTNPAYDFHKDTLDADDKFLLARTGFTGPDRRYIPGTPADVEKEQDAIVERLRADPARQCFYAFRLSDGGEPWTAPILYTAGLHNPPTPPCVNRRTGEVFVILRSAYGVWDGGGEVRSLVSVGRLDLRTGRVALIEHSHKSRDPARPAAGRKDLPFDGFNLIGDETQALSCSPDLLLSNHQGTLGSMAFADGRVAKLWGRRDSYGGWYGPAEWGWEQQGGPERAARAGKPYAMINEWHGPARAIAAVAGNRVYLSVGSQVICLQGGGR